MKTPGAENTGENKTGVLKMECLDHTADNENVNLLWREVQYIDLQIRNLRSDLKYIQTLIETAEREIQFAKKEIESCAP